MVGPFGSGSGRGSVEHRNAFGAQTVDRFRQRARRAPADVIDGMAFAGLRVAFLHQDPHVAESGRAVLDGVAAAL